MASARWRKQAVSGEETDQLRDNLKAEQFLLSIHMYSCCSTRIIIVLNHSMISVAGIRLYTVWLNARI